MELTELRRRARPVLLPRRVHVVPLRLDWRSGRATRRRRVRLRRLHRRRLRRSGAAAPHDATHREEAWAPIDGSRLAAAERTTKPPPAPSKRVPAPCGAPATEEPTRTASSGLSRPGEVRRDSTAHPPSSPGRGTRGEACQQRSTVRRVPWTASASPSHSTVRTVWCARCTARAAAAPPLHGRPPAAASLRRARERPRGADGSPSAAAAPQRGRCSPREPPPSRAFRRAKRAHRKPAERPHDQRPPVLADLNARRLQKPTHKRPAARRRRRHRIGGGVSLAGVEQSVDQRAAGGANASGEAPSARTAEPIQGGAVEAPEGINHRHLSDRRLLGHHRRRLERSSIDRPLHLDLQHTRRRLVTRGLDGPTVGACHRSRAPEACRARCEQVRRTG